MTTTVPPTGKESYYEFLADRCLEAFTTAEIYLQCNRYVSCMIELYRAAEFWWKAIYVLHGKSFQKTHQFPDSNFSGISENDLSTEIKSLATGILAQFPESHRQYVIYGYYEGGAGASPPTVDTDKASAEKRFHDVEKLVSVLQKRHIRYLYRTPVRIGILSGSVQGSDDEKPCTELTHSGFGNPGRWFDRLKAVEQKGHKVFAPNLISVAQLGSSGLTIAVNPFGENFPERGPGEGEAFRTILRFIEDGGVFVNTAGHPFIYSWDVLTGDRQAVVSFLPSVTNVTIAGNGLPVHQTILSGSIPQEATLLTREFSVFPYWDTPQCNGPQRVAITYDSSIGGARRENIKVFRPLRECPECIVPLATIDDGPFGETVYPISCVQYGRGYLLYIGMNLDEEPEFNIAVDVVSRFCKQGYKRLTQELSNSSQ